MSGWVLLGIVAVSVFVFIAIYNRLVALRQTRNQAFADIDVQLKQRFDLIPQLLETVKGYMTHEKEVLENLTAARAQVQSAGSGAGEDRMGAENMLTRALGGFYAVAENYPDLKADGTFQNLMDSLAVVEDKLAAARRFFNNATSELNTVVQQFPAVLIASKFGFGKEEFFEIDEVDRGAYEKAPEIKFVS